MPCKVETHAHTAEVSPCSRLPARELVRLYHQAGYQCLIVTDHYRSDIYYQGGRSLKDRLDHYWHGAEIARKEGERLGLTVLAAMEIGFDGAWSDHLVYGITPEFLQDNPEIFTLGIRQFHALARQHGLLVVQAHPFRNGVTLSPGDCIDGVETWNANLKPEENRRAFEFARQHGLRMTSGSDCHVTPHVGNGGMVFDTPVTSMADFISRLKTDQSCHIGPGDSQ